MKCVTLISPRSDFFFFLRFSIIELKVEQPTGVKYGKCELKHQKFYEKIEKFDFKNKLTKQKRYHVKILSETIYVN